eukprot:366020-Chlamydomonas_euryale.AAC.10
METALRRKRQQGCRQALLTNLDDTRLSRVNHNPNHPTHLVDCGVDLDVDIVAKLEVPQVDRQRDVPLGPEPTRERVARALPQTSSGWHLCCVGPRQARKGRRWCCARVSCPVDTPVDALARPPHLHEPGSALGTGAPIAWLGSQGALARTRAAMAAQSWVWPDKTVCATCQRKPGCFSRVQKRTQAAAKSHGHL